MLERGMARLLAEETNTTIGQCARFIQAFTEILCEQLHKGERVRLNGLGTLFVAQRRGFIYQKPTKEKVEAKPQKRIKVSTSQTFLRGNKKQQKTDRGEKRKTTTASMIT